MSSIGTSPDYIRSSRYGRPFDRRQMSTVGRWAAAALKEIIHGVESTAKEIAEIASAAVEQAANAQEVSKAIQSVSQVTEQAAAGSEEMASSSEELGAQAQSLGELVERFKIDTTSSSTL